MKLWRRIALLLLFVGLSGALAARSGFGAASTRSAALYPLLPTDTAAPTITPVPTSTSVPTITPTLTAYSQPCLASQLRLSFVPKGGVAMGHAAVTYEFANDSSAACSLRGFPNVRLLDAAGRLLPITIVQAPQAFLWPTVPINTIELAPNVPAYFVVQVDTVSETGHVCVTAAKTLISAPQTSPGFAGFVSSVNLGSCDGVLNVSPVVALRSEL